MRVDVVAGVHLQFGLEASCRKHLKVEVNFLHVQFQVRECRGNLIEFRAFVYQFVLEENDEESEEEDGDDDQLDE